MKICLIIYRLDAGGAQRQILALAGALAEAGHEVCLMTCYDGGAFAQENKGDPKLSFVSLSKKNRWDVFGFLWRFFSNLRRLRPDVVYGFLSLANLLSALAKIFIPRTRVVLGVRASNMKLDHYGWTTRAAYRLECALSRFADAVVANSAAGKAYHEKAYLFSGEINVVPNGIDTHVFKPDLIKRRAQRTAWGFSDDHLVIGMAARIDPMKGVSVFIRAAAMAAQKNPKLRFVCAGEGPEKYSAETDALFKETALQDRVVRAGFCRDMSGFYSGIDIYTSASVFGEGFSNSIAEAMACEVPCVVTDVGDAASVLGDCGLVVSAEDPEALAAAWEMMIQNGLGTFGVLGRKRVISLFSIDQMRKQTEAILRAVLEGKGCTGGLG